MNLNTKYRGFFIVIAPLLLLLISSCKKDKLPVLGQKEVVSKTLAGKDVADTLDHKIADFAFVDQDSNWVTNKTFDGKIYVSDFIFTTCPSICPVMRTEMLRVYKKFKDNPDVLILSHTIDPEHDSVPVLKEYAESIGVESSKWHFVTGQQEKIFEIGQKSYMVSATADPDEPSGLLHNGAFILIDKQKRVRGIYDGTKKKEVNYLIHDIELLLEEI